MAKEKFERNAAPKIQPQASDTDHHKNVLTDAIKEIMAKRAGLDVQKPYEQIDATPEEKSPIVRLF